MSAKCSTTTRIINFTDNTFIFGKSKHAVACWGSSYLIITMGYHLMWGSNDLINESNIHEHQTVFHIDN